MVLANRGVAARGAAPRLVKAGGVCEAWRRALLATAAASVLVLAGAQGAKAWTTSTLIMCPTLVQNGNPNTHAAALSATALVDLSGDLAAPTSEANAIAEIDGPTDEDPVLVDQTTNTTNGGSALNRNRERFSATATALSGPAADTFVLTHANAEASVDSRSTRPTTTLDRAPPPIPPL